MTICIAALAEQGNAIVCVTDKMLSFGDYLQWDSDVTKIVPVTGNCGGLMAGSMSHCEAVFTLIYHREEFGKDVDSSAGILRTVYEDKFQMFQDTEVLHRSGIDRKLYKKMLISTQTPRVLERIVEDMQEFSVSKWDCDLMICGFDKNARAFIMAVSAPGNVVVQTIRGYHSIGIASSIANSRILFSKYKREHCLGRVLFDVFDAKVNAEMSTGVGFNWDAQVLFSDGIGVVPEKPLKELLERAWDHHNLSPFEEWNRYENEPKPGRGWKQRILNISRDVLEITKFSQPAEPYPQSTKDDPLLPQP